MNNLIPVSYQEQRILLTSQIAEAYETAPDLITKNFNRNKDRYTEGKHYYCLEGEELRAFKSTTGQIDLSLSKVNKLYLWTEKGAFLHAKSLNTDKAWEVYDHLVDTYFNAKEQKAALQNLSPQLQLLINIELEQQKIQAEVKALETKVDTIKEVVSLDTTSWRTDTKNLINKIATYRGGTQNIFQETRREIYELLDRRFGVNLEQRLRNKRLRMAEEGVCKTKRDNLSKLDVITDDKKLIEGYLIIVKDMAIKYGVA